MNMFCYQCQETAKNEGCKIKGVCGKEDTTSNLQDLLVYALFGIALCVEQKEPKIERKTGDFIAGALFATITNANFNNEAIAAMITEAVEIRDGLKVDLAKQVDGEDLDAITWSLTISDELENKAKEVGVLSYSTDEDIRSLKVLVLYGLKGLAAYIHHAAILGFYNDEIYQFLVKALVGVAQDTPQEQLLSLVLETGEYSVKAMALLDEANTSKYGNPEITSVNLGVGTNPGILISGHDLKDMEELLEQTKSSGVDIYTHGEMLPAHYYPSFKKYGHLVGNYGGSWWKQSEEFDAFNGPILMTTNCIVPVKDGYKERIFTSGMAGYPGVKHIPNRQDNGKKDFSKIIELAKKCSSPKELETGEIVGGFAHNQVLALADKVVEAGKSGAVKRFIVMAGCDGRQAGRKYFTKVAESLPDDTIILTAGCAKYRYNKLKLGDIGGIPRVLDAGQCNDSYSLALIALKLKEVFELEDINDLPISFDIAWYEQKAVCVLLALLFLGFKHIRLGPTLPAFISSNVAQVLIEKFDIKSTDEAVSDVDAMMQGK